MIFTETNLKGAFIIEPERLEDTFLKGLLTVFRPSKITVKCSTKCRSFIIRKVRVECGGMIRFLGLSGPYQGRLCRPKTGTIPIFVEDRRYSKIVSSWMETSVYVERGTQEND